MTTTKADPAIPGRTLVLIPDGVSARTMLYTGLTDTLAARGAVDLAISERCGLAMDRARAIPGARCFELDVYREGVLELFIRRVLEYSHLRVGNTYAMRFILNRPISGRLRHRTVMRSARIVSRVFASRRGVALLARISHALAERRSEVDRYEQLLSEHGVGAVVNAHQRVIDALPVVLAARRLSIPSFSFIFSWDNLTSKGRITPPFDGYFVWSAHMGRELAQFYPDVSEEFVHIVGSPQFEPYGDPEVLLSRDTFAQSLGLRPSDPIICYSGGDEGTCPEDPEHVAVLLELIREGAIRRGAQVVLRPSPADDGLRFAHVRTAFPELVYAPPAWTRPPGGGWASAVPEPEDLVFLANLAHHSDVNVNVASTMTLDFALNDRPVVNIGFDITDPPPHGIPIGEMSRRFDHYRPVLELGAARLASSPAELARLVERALSDPSVDRAERAALVELELGVAPGGANRAVADALDRVIAGRT